MTRTHRSTILIVTALLLGACGGGDDDPADTTAQSDSVPTTIDQDAGTDPEPDGDQAPADTGTDGSDADPATGGDFAVTTEAGLTSARPIVGWDPVAGATDYELLVWTPDGELYWAWQGTETTIPIGGEPQLGPNSAGPALSRGMTWSVIAIGEDGFPVAESARTTHTPG